MARQSLKLALTAVAVAASLLACASTAPPDVQPSQAVAAPAVAPSELFGIRLGMPRDDVKSKLLANGVTFEREERRRHEVWTIANDPRYASLIIGYTPEWNVRFVTAVAKPDGVAVRYADVIDLASAEHRATGATHTYTWTTGTPRYHVIAIGGPERLDYLSIKKDPQS